VIVTDKLKSYAAAKREILPSVEHRQSRYPNNRAEVPHQLTRRSERLMKRIKSARHAQSFLSTPSWIRNHFQFQPSSPQCQSNIIPSATPRFAHGAKSPMPSSSG
jgi:putative transposase